MTKAMMAADAHKPFVARTPMARVGTPADVAGAVLFLTSAAAAFITGRCRRTAATRFAAEPESTEARLD